MNLTRGVAGIGKTGRVQSEVESIGTHDGMNMRRDLARRNNGISTRNENKAEERQVTEGSDRFKRAQDKPQSQTEKNRHAEVEMQ